MNNNNSSIIQNALLDLFMEAITPGSSTSTSASARTSASSTARTSSRAERPTVSATEIPVTQIYNRPNRTNMGTMPTNVQTQRVNVLNGMIRDYNKNILEYQRNMRDIIDTVYEIQPVNSVIYNTAETYAPNVSRPVADEPRSRSSTQPRTRAPIHNPYAYFEYTISPIHNTTYTHSGLTSAQIALHTRPLIYDTSMSTNTCPISLDTFQAGDAILEICGCGHIFKETHLRTWLTRNFRCPVCRYDVQTYRSTTQSHAPRPESSSNTRTRIFNGYDSDSSSDEEESKEEDVLEEEKTDDISRNSINNSNEIMQNLTQLFRGMVQNTDVVDGNIYSFEIPLYDASYNT